MNHFESQNEGERTEESDEALVDAANRGRAEAFEALYRRYRTWTIHLAERLTGDHELALDVCQETFLYLLKKFPGFELRASFKAVLYPVVRHMAISRQSRERHRRMMQRGIQPQDEASGSGQGEGLIGGLRAVMDRLSDAHREVLILRFVDELALAEIAAALEIPLGTVKSRLHQALAALKADDMTKKYFEP